MCTPGCGGPPRPWSPPGGVGSGILIDDAGVEFVELRTRLASQPIPRPGIRRQVTLVRRIDENLAADLFQRSASAIAHANAREPHARPNRLFQTVILHQPDSRFGGDHLFENPFGHGGLIIIAAAAELYVLRT